MVVEDVRNADEDIPSPARLKIFRRVLFSAFFVLLLAMIFVGLRIYVGYILGYLASISLVVALTCRWQRIRKFLFLILFSVLIAIIYSMIHVEVISRVVGAVFGEGAFNSTGWKIFKGLTSDILLFFAPACVLVGIGGSIVLYTRRIIARTQKGT